MCEAAAAVIEEEQRSIRAQDHQVLASRVAQIQEQRGAGPVEHAQTRTLGDVVEAAVAAVLVETIRQSPRLADVDFVPAVTIDVPDGHAVGPVDVDATGRIDPGAPMRNAAAELSLERLRRGKRAGRDVDEQRLLGRCSGLLQRRELEQAIVAPDLSPVTDPVFEASRRTAADLIANLDANVVPGRCLDPRHEEPRGSNVSHLIEPSAETGLERFRIAVEDAFEDPFADGLQLSRSG